MASPWSYQRPNYYRIVARERALLDQHYTFLRHQLHDSGLVSTGIFQPTPLSEAYTYRIVYTPPRAPRVYVRAPVINYHDDIHMFPSDNSLCLYHHTDLRWNMNCHLYDTIVPWTHEWFVNYELYMITGQWHHPFVRHAPGGKQRN